MKLVHIITEDRGDYTFVIYNYYTGDVKEVRVDADKYALYEDRSSLEGLPDACPFLRFDAEGKAWHPANGPDVSCISEPSLRIRKNWGNSGKR